MEIIIFTRSILNCIITKFFFQLGWVSPFFGLYLVYVIEDGSQSCDIPMIATRISYGAAYIRSIQGSDKRYILPVFTLQLLIIIVFRWLISTNIKSEILKFESWLIDWLINYPSFLVCSWYSLTVMVFFWTLIDWNIPRFPFTT